MNIQPLNVSQNNRMKNFINYGLIETSLIERKRGNNNLELNACEKNRPGSGSDGVRNDPKSLENVLAAKLELDYASLY